MTDSFSFFLTLSEDKICQNKMIEDNIEILNCTKINCNITDILAINQTHFLTSFANGTISYWENENFYPTLSKQLSEILQKCDYCNKHSDNVHYVNKLTKLNNYEIAAFLDEKINLIVDENLELKFFNNNLIEESPIEIIRSNANELIYAYPSGNLKLYGSKLFLNKVNFDDYINFKYYLTQEDNKIEIVIKFQSIPSCLIVLNGDNKLEENSIVNKDDRLRYNLIPQSSCETNTQLKFSTILNGVELNNYIFYIELIEPPVYKTTDIQITSSATNIFQLSALCKEIKFVIFKGVNLGKIMYCSDCKALNEIEENKEYDSNYKFFFIVDFENKIKNNPVILMPIVLKDKFGISSEVINIKLIYNLIIPWYKRWYTIVAFIFAIIIGLNKAIKWIDNKGYLKFWEKLKKFVNCISNCFKKCFCCCCRKKSSFVSVALIPNKEF